MLFFFTNTLRFSILTLVFLFMGMEFAAAQDVKSLLQELENLQNDSLIRLKAQEILEKQDLNGNENIIGKAYYYLASSFDEKNNYKAIEFYKKANELLENDSVLEDSFFRQSRIHTIFSEFPEAMKMALKSLEYNKLNNNLSKVQRDMSYIGYINDRMYEFKASIDWNRKSLVIAKQLKDTMAMAYCFGRIGIAYDELAEKDDFNPKLFDSALYYNNKAAKYAELTGNLGYARTTYSNIGNSFSKLKNYKKAEEYTLKSLAIPGFEESKGVTLVNLGKIYLETGRYNEAKKILDSAMQNTVKYGTRKYQLEAFYRLHELDVKKNDYKNALKNYIDYKSIEDSLLNETKTKQIVEAQEQYKTAEKEREILMQRTTLAEQDLIIQERNYQIFGLIALAVIMSVIGYLIYKQQQLKNNQLKKESELKDALLKIETQNKLQEQRLRISRDLHDNIGAQLTFIISSIDNLKYAFEINDHKLKHKLNTISDFTSSTIYELRDTIWAMNKNKITFEDLQTRISNYIDKAHLSDAQVKFEFNVESNVDTSEKFSSVEGMNILRIIQEAIHNSLKYANAKRINVDVSKKNSNVEFQISDDGAGFDLEKVKRGNGLNNMEKRAMEINGSLDIKSGQGKGTTIILSV
ncbi:sensor histidine kinase [Winogradskyella sp. SYSU M77433]|uniref:tetratricopeptide repeat-containing sensor histidine kinase n=1 Tax=Winogradskyella sp. SYSU M77433 TaxID=3042722 RepID=UPI0024816D91|nr:sensor histidine kinase [Winogradskyella sp. SYSU M77433]MDH7913249.1 sensor histidine kinase [Winogradskyella sp. SYSU M77433]